MKITSLKKRSHFINARKQGVVYFTRHLIVQAIDTKKNPNKKFLAQNLNDSYNEADDIVRVGYTVSKKIGNAVKRNRVKRQLRAIVQDIFYQYGKIGIDYVLIAKKNDKEPTYKEIYNDMSYAVKKLNKQISESSNSQNLKAKH